MIDFALEATFTGNTLASVMDQFNQEIRPAKPKLWPFPRSTNQNTCMLVKLHVPAKFRDAGLNCVGRLQKNLPPGWIAEPGDATSDGTYQLTVEEQQVVQPSPGNETDNADIANGLLGFIQRKLGIASPSSRRDFPEIAVLEKLKSAVKFARSESHPLIGQIEARLTITYCRPALEPALVKIVERLNKKNQKPGGNCTEYKLIYLPGYIEETKFKKLEEYWMLVDIQYADEQSFEVTGEDPSTHPDPDLVDVDPATQPDPGSLTLTVTRGGKAAKSFLEVDERGKVMLGRCGPQKNSVCQALRQLDALQFLSSQTSLALELLISGRGATVTKRGKFTDMAGKALMSGQYLPFPISAKSGNFIFEITQS